MIRENSWPFKFQARNPDVVCEILDVGEETERHCDVQAEDVFV